MAISRETYTNIAKLVREFFEEIGLLPVHELPDCKILRKRLMGKDLANHTVSSTDLVGVCENESVLFGYYDSQKPVATLLEDIAECHTMEDTVETVHVVVFAESIQEILALNKEKNKLVKKVRACMPLCQKQADTTGSTVKAPSVKFYTMHVPQWGENIATIDIESRICALHHGYMQWYRPINFANEIGNRFEEAEKAYSKGDKCDKNVTAVLAYGRYYFIAFTVKSLNPQMDLTQEEPDFSQFPYWADHAKKLDTDMILRFAKLVAALAGDVQLDSNHFKKEEFYSQWCTYAETSEEAQQWLADCKNALGEKTLISPLG